MKLDTLIVRTRPALLALLTSIGACSGGGNPPPPPPPPPGTLALAATTYDANEGATIDIVVTRSGGNFGAATVDYASMDVTATAGADYPISIGTLTWANGDTADQTISIAIPDDAELEATEIFTLLLSNASGATLGAESSANINVFDSLDHNMGSAWVARSPLSDARFGPSACTLDGKIYLFGGSDFGFVAEEYDPATGQRTPLAPIPTSRRYGAACAVLDDRIYLIGGYSEASDRLDNVDVYDPTTDMWTAATPLPEPRFNVAAAELNGRIFAVGGRNLSTQNSDRVDIYDPTTDSWTPSAPLPAGHHSPTAVVAGGALFVIGGFLASGPSDAVYEYDAVNAVWLTRAAMPTPRHEHASAVLDGVIYVTGGAIGTMGIATVEAYDPQTDTWESKSDMPAVRASHATASYRNTVYVFGGRETSAFQSSLATVASYAPVSD